MQSQQKILKPTIILFPKKDVWFHLKDASEHCSIITLRKKMTNDLLFSIDLNITNIEKIMISLHLWYNMVTYDLQSDIEGFGRQPCSLTHHLIEPVSFKNVQNLFILMF